MRASLCPGQRHERRSFQIQECFRIVTLPPWASTILFDDREAEARSGFVAGWVPMDVPIEDARQQLRGNTTSRVRDLGDDDSIVDPLPRFVFDHRLE